MESPVSTSWQCIPIPPIVISRVIQWPVGYSEQTQPIHQEKAPLLRLERLRIRGYRSLKDLELRPSQFSVLVGLNNAGKSNILDAIHFLSLAYEYSPLVALDRMGGFINLAYRDPYQMERRIGFEVEVSAAWSEIERFASDPVDEDRPLEHPNVRVVHAFELVGEEDNVADFSIQNETVRLETVRDAPRTVLELQRFDNSVKLSFGDNSDDKQLLLGPFYSENPEFLERMLTDIVMKHRFAIQNATSASYVLYRSVSFLSEMRIYQLAPRESRASASLSPSPSLGFYGEGLPSLIYYLKNNAEWAWAVLMEFMSTMLPGLSRIDIEYSEIDRVWTLRFVEDSGRIWNANEVSDGTIRTLAMLATILNYRRSLAAIDEPENSVHPWTLRAFVQLCKSIANLGNGHQTLLTTHSPILINHIDPDDIFVVWNEHGETKICPLVELEPAARSDWTEGAARLFDLLDSGMVSQLMPGHTE